MCGVGLDLLRVKAAEKGLELACDIALDVPPAIVGDVTRLRQILVNLLGNAVKFTEAGEVVVTVEQYIGKAVDGGIGELETGTSGGETRSTPPPIYQSANLPVYQLHFSVRDTGIGIPPDRIDRLFQAFSQVDASTPRKYGGTGLGLAVSKRLAEMMNGKMWAESTGAGKGSTFHFVIEAQAAPEVMARPHLRGEQPELAGRRLLIVDDNATNRRILVMQARVGDGVTRYRVTARGLAVVAGRRSIRRGHPGHAHARDDRHGAGGRDPGRKG